MSLFDLTGKSAFVTGASRGIGRVIAVALAEAGADVALVARSEEGLAETAEAIDALGRKAFVIPADVTSQEAVATAVEAAIDRLGQVDVVVNNAGGSNFMVGFRDLRLAGWDKLIRLNLDSAVYVCHAFAGHLLDRGAGSVINVASVAGVAASPFLTRTGIQGGADLADEVTGGRVGRQGHRVKRAVQAGPRPTLSSTCGRTRRPDRRRSRPCRCSGGAGRRRWRARGVPGQRRVVLHDRPGPDRRRRPDRQPVAASPGTLRTRTWAQTPRRTRT